MSLKEMLEQLYTRRRFGIRPGVERVAGLLERLGSPHRSYPSVHVVGTNGKGSTSAFLASILTAAGYRTAQFSSPHLISFCERFRIDGAECKEQRCAAMLERVLAAANGNETFFEVVTALAAYMFSEEQVDFAVIEAGMGGVSDATAMFPGGLTVVTPVSIDHADYLGQTVAGIAAEKCAIAKPGSIVVSALQHPDADAAIAAICRERKCRLYREPTDFRAVWTSSATLDYYGIHATLSNLAPGISGRYQSQNAAVAMAAAELVQIQGREIGTPAMREGLNSARWPGRMELIPGQPPILLDGAHNPAGARALADSLSDYRRQRLLVVLGMCCDKDMEQTVLPLLPLTDRFFTVTPAVERAMSDRDLADLLARQGATAQPCGAVAAGIAAARSAADREDLVVVCGSLFVVGEARALFAGEEFTGIRG